MKRNLIIIPVLVLIVFSITHAIPIADPQNPHNLSNLATHGGLKSASTLGGGTDQICVFCHAPHSTAPQSPLWNRPDPDGMGTFPLYAQPLVIKDNPIESGYATGSEYPNGASRMCLSCHDGTTSIGVVLAGPSIQMEGGVTTLSNSISLATSHPVSFTYDAVVKGLIESSKPASYQLPGVGVDTPLDSDERMQCTTCHDPHESTSGELGYDFLPFWRHPGDATSYVDVCNNCHIAPPISGSLPHNLP